VALTRSPLVLVVAMDAHSHEGSQQGRKDGKVIKERDREWDRQDAKQNASSGVGNERRSPCQLHNDPELVSTAADVISCQLMVEPPLSDRPLVGEEQGGQARIEAGAPEDADGGLPGATPASAICVGDTASSREPCNAAAKATQAAWSGKVSLTAPTRSTLWAASCRAVPLGPRGRQLLRPYDELCIQEIGEVAGIAALRHYLAGAAPIGAWQLTPASNGTPDAAFRALAAQLIDRSAVANCTVQFRPDPAPWHFVVLPVLLLFRLAGSLSARMSSCLQPVIAIGHSPDLLVGLVFPAAAAPQSITPECIVKAFRDIKCCEKGVLQCRDEQVLKAVICLQAASTLKHRMV